jgi:hypothetical protein
MPHLNRVSTSYPVCTAMWELTPNMAKSSEVFQEKPVVKIFIWLYQMFKYWQTK